MRDKDGIIKPLDRFEPSIAKETLGVHIAMDGNWRTQKTVLMNISKRFATQMQSSQMDKKEAWYAFTVSFMKKIEYPMHATSLTFNDWEEIMQPALPPSSISWV